MPHLLVAGSMHASGLALLEAAPGVTFDYVTDADPAAYAAFLGAAEGLIIRTQPLTAAMIATAPRLRVVSRHGVGVDSLDVAALSARGIPVAIAIGSNARSVAEHAMALILAAAKDLRGMDRAVRSGDWAGRSRFAGRELGGSRLLILGYGRSGRMLARMAAGFDMTVEVYDPFLDAAALAGGPVARATDLDAALAAADVVSVHAPKGDRPLLGAGEIARLKPGAIVVNTARGGMVDEAALAAALREGRVAGAGLDVFADEPPARDAPLLGAEAAVLTPHVAGLSREAMEAMAVISAQNALDFFHGRLDPAMIANRDDLPGG